jgi:hypothetical protein
MVLPLRRPETDHASQQYDQRIAQAMTLFYFAVNDRFGADWLAQRRAWGARIERVAGNGSIHELAQPGEKFAVVAGAPDAVAMGEFDTAGTCRQPYVVCLRIEVDQDALSIGEFELERVAVQALADIHSAFIYHLLDAANSAPFGSLPGFVI